MNVQEILEELESLGTERTKNIYIQHGAREPLFGVTIGAMKPIAKKNKKNQELAEILYGTNNYDAMYLAGMIADPSKMTREDFERWMENAYFYMLSDYVVASTLSETDFAEELADRWIKTNKELYLSAGYSCYSFLLMSRKDEEFNKEKLRAMLDTVKETIHDSPNRARYSMNNFVTAVGVSYLPLHEEALTVAEAIGPVEVFMGKTHCQVPVATEEIQKVVSKGRLGYKRKNARC